MEYYFSFIISGFVLCALSVYLTKVLIKSALMRIVYCSLDVHMNVEFPQQLLSFQYYYCMPKVRLSTLR